MNLVELEAFVSSITDSSLEYCFDCNWQGKSDELEWGAGWGNAICPRCQGIAITTGHWWHMRLALGRRQEEKMMSKETIAQNTQDWKDMKAMLDKAESSGSSSVICLTRAVKLLASIVWHHGNKPPTATQADPCGRMARWSLHFFVGRKTAYLCSEHMHVLADVWEAKIEKIVLERLGDHLCDYLGSE